MSIDAIMAKIAQELKDNEVSLKFTPEMFYNSVPPNSVITAELMARVSQKLFDKWLSEQPIVFGNCAGARAWTYENDNDTHTARLVCVEEIQKKECEHFATVMFPTGGGESYMGCKHCKRRLKPTGGWVTE